MTSPIADTIRGAVGAIKDAARQSGGAPTGGPRTQPPPNRPPPSLPWWQQQLIDQGADPSQLPPAQDLTLDRLGEALATPPETGLRGVALLEYQIRMAPHRPGTPEFDEWILTLQPSPGATGGPRMSDRAGVLQLSSDPEYDHELQRRQRAAAQRKAFRESNYEDSWARQIRRMREEGTVRAGLPVPAGTTEGAGKFAGEQFQQYEVRPAVTVLGPDGQPLPNQYVVTRDGTIQPYLAEAAAGLTAQLEVGMAALQSGSYVWLGDTVGTTQEGAFTRPTVQDAYMAGEDAIMLPYHWSPEQVTYAQEMLGLDPTGFVDQDLINRWSQIIYTAAGYTQAGRRVDPFTILDWVGNANAAAGRGRGGGGGGGGGGAGVDVTQAKALLNRAMLTEAGREATDDEVSAFHAAVSGVGPEVDIGQFAIDWVRSIAGEEAGAYQAATDYYQAMMAVLGAQTQAKEAV